MIKSKWVKVALIFLIIINLYVFFFALAGGEISRSKAASILRGISLLVSIPLVYFLQRDYFKNKKRQKR